MLLRLVLMDKALDKNPNIIVMFREIRYECRQVDI